MTTLTVAARNELARDPEIQALVGSSPGFGPWVFEQKPFVRVENKQTCLIVITRDGSWTSANDYNTEQFPRMVVDVWADPERNIDHAVRVDDTQDKIDALGVLIKRHFHLVDGANPDGTAILWDDLRINSSKFTTGPDIFPISDGNGGQMGRFYFNVSIN